MPSAKKVQVVQDLKEKIGRAQSVVFAQYSGMNVKQQNQLRVKIKQAGGEVVIAKNRLVDVALDRPAGLGKELQQQLLTLFSYEDPISAVKALVEFIDENSLPVIKGGFFENKVLSTAQVEQLAKTPSKPEMIATMLRTIQGPIYGLRNVLEAGPRNLVYVLKAVSEKK